MADQYLLYDIAALGSRLCGYCQDFNREQWAKGPCDCKYLGKRGGFAASSDEQTGCCEIREVYRHLGGYDR